jgi:hypothetical protein
VSLHNSWRVFASVIWASVSSGLRGPSDRRYRSELMGAQPGHFILTNCGSARSNGVRALGHDALETKLAAVIE